jgi:Kef-type K+ transport system membrane component KefB
MVQEFLDFILALSIIIVAAKAGGYISTRLNQPSVLGELLAGLILGPTVFDMLHTWPVFSREENLGEFITLMAELGVILLMLLAGLELHLSELLSSGKVAALAGVLGVVVPFGMGYGAAIAFGVQGPEALLIGLTLSATSVSISAQTLMELGVLRSRVGLAMLGAAVFDDIMVILLLSIAFLVVGDAGGGIGAVAVTILRMIGYLVGAIIVGVTLIPRLASRIDSLPISQGLMAFVLVSMLLYAWAAEVIGGMATITGAFLLGLFLARTQVKERIEQGVIALAYGFFVPIFFVNIGLEVNMRDIGSSGLVFALVITVIAVVSKILGSGVGARLGGFDLRRSLQLGIGMVSRGEVGLIVAAIGLSEGFLSPANFSVVVFMVIVATLLTPPMLRASFKEREPVEPAETIADSQVG